MPTFVFNKIVRDKIIDQMQMCGDVAQWRKLDREQSIKALRDKINEEASELRLDEDMTNEMADLYEILDCLAESVGLPQQQIKAAQRQKRLNAGSFSKGIFIDRVEAQQDSPWLDYYLKHPDKYPQYS